jgi:hypothetical protein
MAAPAYDHSGLGPGDGGNGRERSDVSAFSVPRAFAGYPAVVIPIMMQHYTQRNLLYTGVARPSLAIYVWWSRERSGEWRFQYCVSNSGARRLPRLELRESPISWAVLLESTRIQHR